MLARPVAWGYSTGGALLVYLLVRIRNSLELRAAHRAAPAIAEKRFRLAPQLRESSATVRRCGGIAFSHLSQPLSHPAVLLCGLAVDGRVFQVFVPTLAVFRKFLV